MNQIRDWQGVCQKCLAEADKHTMSLHDVALICMDCAERERENYQRTINSRMSNEKDE
jgi:hypothetical protein